VSQAIELGLTMMDGARHGPDVARRVAAVFNGELVARGTVAAVELRTEGGFDSGLVTIEEPGAAAVKLTFWNEFMTCDRGGTRLATFPDLIAVIDTEGGEAVTSAELQPGDEVTVIAADRGELRLGAGMRSAQLMKEAEQAVGQRLL